MSEPRFQIRPIDPAVADELRAGGGAIYVADANPGYPCRQCLHDAAVGEELVLVSHDFFTGDSPYRAASPIFLHRRSCPPYEGIDEIPLQLTRRQLSVRAFDSNEMMLDACVVDGVELDVTLDRLLGQPGTHHLHVHNAARGCWATRVDPVDSFDEAVRP
jgi:hypothetical protein